jgi:hypothetical protein
MQALLAQIAEVDRSIRPELVQCAKDIVQWCGDELCPKSFRYDDEKHRIIFDWTDKNGRNPFDWMIEYRYSEHCMLTIQLDIFGRWNCNFHAPGIQSLMSYEKFQGFKSSFERKDRDYIKVFLGLAPPFWIGKYRK